MILKNINFSSKILIKIIIGLFILNIMVISCDLFKRNNHINHPSFIIETERVKSHNVPIYINTFGNVSPNFSVIIKPQISGVITRIIFKEGKKVKKGDLLAQLDSRIYEAQLEQYQGQLNRDQALLDNALLDLKRYKILWQQKSIAKQILDGQISLVKQYQGTVQMDIGLVESAKVNLSYCDITAPFAGVIGLQAASEGSYIDSSNINGIATINVIDPMPVTFSIPENKFVDLKVELKKNKILRVDAFNQDKSILLAKGYLDSIDNQIDSSTGSVKLKALFNNKNNSFFPNQFVNVRILLKIVNNALIIPISAVQYGNKDCYVYLIEKNIIQRKSLKLGANFGDHVIVESGLVLGQQIAVSGIDRLSDGVHVLVKTKKQLN